MTLRLIGTGRIYEIIDAESVLEVILDPTMIGEIEAMDEQSEFSFTRNIQRAKRYCRKNKLYTVEEIQRVLDEAEWIPDPEDRPSS